MDRVLHSAPVAGLRRLLQAAFRGRPRLTAAIFLLTAAGAWAVAFGVAWLTWDLTMNLPRGEALRGVGEMAEATTLYDRNDQPVFTIFKEQRIEIPLSAMSPMLVKAVVSVEDQRFYTHRGIDVIRVAGAFVANLRSGRRAQGGSTITQQLARMGFLTRKKDIRRKLKEMLLATQIEHEYSKDQILELYLNKYYFGDGFYGVEAAARGYFSTSASDLTVAQAALLAGLIQSPSAYAPTGNLQRAVTRRNAVLLAMLETGAIDRAQHDEARAAEVVLKNGLQKDEASGLYFKEAVRRELVDRFGWERVSEGGLRVYTTIDLGLQEQVEHLVDESLERIEERKDFPHTPRSQVTVREDEVPDYLQAAAVSLDPASGEVLAMVGGREFRESRFNRALQGKRQPGSAFKPILYATAVEHGMSAATVLTGLNDPVLTPTGAWMPEDEHSASGSMSLRSALRSSSNRAAARLIREVGIEKTLAMVDKLHLGPMPAVPSLALGSGEVTLMNLSAAYAAFANGGWVRRPILVRRVVDSDGLVLYQDTGQPERAMSEQTAFILASMLQDVINHGTAARARGLGFSLPAGGKTGTTNDYVDTWFVGFTPHVLTGVWVGFDQPRTIFPRGYAADVAVPMWTAIMKVATEGAEPEWLERPDGLVGVSVCRLSGKRAGEGCESVLVEDEYGEPQIKSMAYTEYFVKGTEPSEECDLHLAVGPGTHLAGDLASEPGAATGEPGTAAAAHPVAEERRGEPGHAEPDRRGEDARAEPEKGAGRDAVREEEAPKKRGFWSRLLGIGKDKDTPADGKDPKTGQPVKKKPSEPRD